MRRSIAILGIIALAMAAAAAAQEPTQPRPEQQQQKAEKTFMGEIASVNETAKTITVKEPGPMTETARPEASPAAAEKSMTFSVDTQTEITTSLAAKPAQPGQERPTAGQKDELELKDLKEGDRVTVKYSEDAGKNVAKSIEVISHATSSN